MVTEALPQKTEIFVGSGQYRNAVASGFIASNAKHLVCARLTRRYRVTVLTSSKCAR